MKKIILFIVSCLFVSGCAGNIDKKLIGTWKSDREKTVAECMRCVPNRFDIRPERKERFAELFGHMVHSYTENELTTEYKGEVIAGTYEIIERGDKFLIIRIHFECTDDQIVKIRFENNFESYWVNEDTEFPENFTKIMPNKLMSLGKSSDLSQ